MRKQLEIDAMQKVSLESVTLVTDTEEAVLVNSALAPKSLDSLITVLEGVWRGEYSPLVAGLVLNTEHPGWRLLPRHRSSARSIFLGKLYLICVARVPQRRCKQ